jgi:uncharacterized protein YcaQ
VGAGARQAAGVRLTPVPLRAVAALFLERQHLERPHAQRLTRRRLSSFAEDVGGIQMDSINVVARAHYLTVWSRFGPYDPRRLDRLVYDERLLIEYWAHAACLVPVSTLPWWRCAMRDYRPRHTGWSGWLRRNRRVLADVTRAIGERGPLGGADFRGRRGQKGRGGWWDWGPVQHALHYLWMSGAILVHSRRHFQKRFDLAERLVPPPADGLPSLPDFQRWHAERSLHAMGAATAIDVARYLTYPRFPPGVRRTALAGLARAGAVVEVPVEGQASPWLVLARDLPALARAARRTRGPQGTTLLSPFDSFLWHRERVGRLFGFDYRIEVYTPSAERIHGYYTLPILHRGQLIGRVDAKHDRPRRRLQVHHVSLEPWFAAGGRPPAADWGRLEPDEGLAGLSRALWSLAAFLGAAEVVTDRVTPARLGTPFRRALREAGDPAIASGPAICHDRQDRRARHPRP